MEKLKRAGIEVMWHGKRHNEGSHYCAQCDVSMGCEQYDILYTFLCAFHVLFVWVHGNLSASKIFFLL